jgi:hypothetical protein
MISKSTLLSCNERRIEKVDLPLDGDHVFVRSLTTSERDKYELASIETGLNSGSRVMMLIQTVCDESGELVFTEEDAEVVGAMDIRVSQPIYNKALDMAYFSEKDIKELEKN